MSPRQIAKHLPRAAAALALVLASAVTVAATERLTVLSPEAQAAWTAVGLVASRGPDGAVSCTGTLVAPDLVITAAHCVAHETGLMEGIQFFAGQNGTRRAAISSAVEVIRYPVWDFATGRSKVRWDLAILRLGRLIPRETLQPMNVFPAETPLPRSGTLLGYQGRGAHRLHGNFDCDLERSEIPGVLRSNCRVTQGNSGGPVLVRDGENWFLAGIIVASDENAKTSVLVETNAWLLEQVRAAQAREAARAE